jgi:hypothetical protein
MDFIHLPGVTNNVVKFDFGLTISLHTTDKTIVNILPVHSLLYEAIFFKPKCDFSIALNNSGERRALVNIRSGNLDFGNFVVRQSEEFVLHTTPRSGKRFHFDATISEDRNYENLSSDLEFLVYVEKAIPDGHDVRIKSLQGNIEIINIDINCTILELKHLYSLKKPFKTRLIVKRDPEDIELSNILQEDNVSEYTQCEDHRTLRYYNLDKKTAYAVYDLRGGGSSGDGSAIPGKVCFSTPVDQSFETCYNFLIDDTKLIPKFIVTCKFASCS